MPLALLTLKFMPQLSREIDRKINGRTIPNNGHDELVTFKDFNGDRHVMYPYWRGSNFNCLVKANQNYPEITVEQQRPFKDAFSKMLHNDESQTYHKSSEHLFSDDIELPSYMSLIG